MKRKILIISAIFFIIIAAAPHAEAQRNKTSEHKLDSELLTDDYNAIRIELDSACVDWICPSYLGKRVHLYYGSRFADSTIFLSTARSNLKNLIHDSIVLPGSYKVTKNSGVYPVVVKESDNYPLFVYSPKAPFEYIIHENQIDSLESEFSPNIYFNAGNKIIKIISDAKNSLKAFYLDERFGKGVIMCISSKDNGKSWGYPVKSLSSNTDSFVHATMSQARNGKLYTLLVNGDGKAFVCNSEDYGHTWTYPKELSRRMNGHGHSMTIHRSGAFIVYRLNEADAGNNFKNGDYILWTSSVNELDNGAGQGTFKRIMKNETANENEVKDINIIHLSNNRYMLTVLYRLNGKCVAECYKFAGNFYL